MPQALGKRGREGFVSECSLNIDKRPVSIEEIERKKLLNLNLSLQNLCDAVRTFTADIFATGLVFYKTSMR